MLASKVRWIGGEKKEKGGAPKPSLISLRLRLQIETRALSPKTHCMES